MNRRRRSFVVMGSRRWGLYDYVQGLYSQPASHRFESTASLVVLHPPRFAANASSSTQMTVAATGLYRPMPWPFVYVQR